MLLDIVSDNGETMHCFQHQNVTALGICKACQKAVCGNCAIDVGNGIACSDECAKEVKELNQVIERNKQIYGIGDSASRYFIPSGILVYVFFTVLFLGWSAFDYFSQSKVDTFLIVMGAGFMLMGIIMYRRARKLQINC